MQVQRSFKPEIAEKLETIPVDELEKLLSKAQRKAEKVSETSQWANLTKKIQKRDYSPEVWEHIVKYSKEFREEFAFKHDLEVL